VIEQRLPVVDFIRELGRRVRPRNALAIGYLGVFTVVVPLVALGQQAASITARENLPSAPAPSQTQAPTAPAMPSPPQQASPSAATANAPTLSLQEAQALAVKNNPQISVAHLVALASHQVTREARSNLWPTATASVTGVDAESGTRITAGALNNPIVYERAAVGTEVTQLIYDFGRTSNLVASATYAEKAQDQNAVATREQILLAVDQAFYSALQTQSVLTVAEQTVKERQTVANQVNQLFKNKLKSQLDLSFANVNLAQAQLLLLDAQNNDNAARASLSMVLGFSNLQNYRLLEQTTTPAAPPANIDDLIATAFAVRPEILALQFQVQSANKFRVAERDLLFPNIRALGVIGDTPYGNPVVANTWYGAVGGDMEIPIFNGFLFTARAREARLRAEATNERLRDMRDQIARDVRTSWLNANTAYQRLSVTQQLLEQANLGLSLAQTRYQMGLGSIVELSQAQLQQTQAQITYVQAGYDYQLALATLTYETKGL
jgi:outer membrane protein